MISRQRKSRQPSECLVTAGLLLSFSVSGQSNDPQVHRDGLRASDKGFLRIDWSSYKKLLGWVAENKPRVLETGPLPKPLNDKLIEVGSCSRDAV